MCVCMCVMCHVSVYVCVCVSVCVYSIIWYMSCDRERVCVLCMLCGMGVLRYDDVYTSTPT